MINSVDVNDLQLDQLEDVEDYSSDYPPSGFPQSEQNIAAIGMPQDSHVSKKRTNRLVALVRANKWSSGLVFLVVIILIAILAIAGGSARQEPVPVSSGSGTHQKPIYIDPKSLDPAVTEALLQKVLSVYTRKGLDASVLDGESGTTPQKKAFYWLASESDLNDLNHTQLMQRYALAVFYYATNAQATPYTEKPKPWVSAHLWLSTTHVCEWKGIVCNDQDHVESIDLERNNLSGSLPAELVIIGSTLQTLDLTSNLIYMEDDMFDVFENLTELRTLLMDDNFLLYDNGLPPQFKKLERLQKIRLSYNLFSGQLEKEHKVLASMAQLTHLELESNFLSGSLPSVIGNMTNLVYIYLRRNDLNFNLDFLKGGKLKDLFALWLDSNAITGTIPTEIGLLTELASISMTNGTLSGPIPTEMGNLVNLRRLWLYNNQLTGTIPAVLNQLTDLEVLELHFNKIGGAMPQGICANIDSSDYEFKSLTSDCVKEVKCDGSCCTDCY